MNNYVENDTFEFGNKEGTFDYNSINGTGEINYENSDLFNTEISSDNEINVFPVSESQVNQISLNAQQNIEPASPVASPLESAANNLIQNDVNGSVSAANTVQIQEPVIPVETNDISFNQGDSTVSTINPFVASNSTNLVNEVKQEIVQPQTSNGFNLYTQMSVINSPEVQEQASQNNTQKISDNTQANVLNEPISTVNPFVVPESLNLVNESKQEIEQSQSKIDEPIVSPVEVQEPAILSSEVPVEQQFVEPINTLENQEPAIGSTTNLETPVVVDEQNTPFFEINTEDNVQSQEVDVSSAENTQESPVDTKQSSGTTISMSNDDLLDLTEFKEEDKLKTTDIKSLFDKVGVNVREASDIFKRNTEMKEKIDSRFEELKKLQSEVSKIKQNQYDEINAYKEEVLAKLTEKKDEIEIRLNKLKEFQTSLEKEKIEFEQYRKQQKEEIERVQKEVQDAYDSRREELKRIEDVLRKQKDFLDEERNQLSLDRIQYESDKNELANNLLKFNEIVDSFTNGIDKIDKE